jgi:hypothetical protein
MTTDVVDPRYLEEAVSRVAELWGISTWSVKWCLTLPQTQAEKEAAYAVQATAAMLKAQADAEKVRLETLEECAKAIASLQPAAPHNPIQHIEWFKKAAANVFRALAEGGSK